MNLNIILKRPVYMLLVVAVLCLLSSCQPEDVGEGNGLSDANVDATFTIKPVEGKVNTYSLQAQPNNVIQSLWNFGDGEFAGKMTEEASFPDAGTYTIIHKAVGRGGLSNSISQEVVVATSDPIKGNIVKGGKFLDAADQAKWIKLNISASGAAWTFNAGSATIKASGWNQQGIYQAIEVVKDKEYRIDMLISGGASSETWFEVYAGKTPPVQGVEYKDNKVMGISTWDGCGTSQFSGKLSVVGCIKNDRTKTVSNVVKFDTSGTIYLLFRSGGNGFTSNGITITNVEMRGN